MTSYIITRNRAENYLSHPWSAGSESSNFSELFKSVITGEGVFVSSKEIRERFDCLIAARVEHFEPIEGVLNIPVCYRMGFIPSRGVIFVDSGIPEDHQHRFLGQVTEFEKIILFSDLSMFCVNPKIGDIYRVEKSWSHVQRILSSVVEKEPIKFDREFALELINANRIVDND